MKLRGKKPTAIEKRLKALFYGAAGVGKTMASISFPKPYLIDTERGAENSQYIEILEKNDGAIAQTNDFDELIEEVKALLTIKHDYKTLVIDPLTTLYNDLLDKAEKKVGSEFGRHYGQANKSMKQLLNLLLRLDMNVIVTAHAKNEYGANLAILGQTFDCYKKLDYLFDLVFEIQKRGKERVGLVKKTRIKTFEEGETFPFNYKTIADKYGRDILEKEATQEILASDEQLTKLQNLIQLLKLPTETTDKWISKAGANTFNEMKSEDVQKCIDFLTNQIDSTNTQPGD